MPGLLPRLLHRALHHVPGPHSCCRRAQILTGDSWAQEIARPILEEYPASAAFFVSCVIMLCNMVLINVVVAFAKAGQMSRCSRSAARQLFV
mmetsp:Transcript_35576/g.71298  ORF Transcript_35576/g.71298 Transcript_35576/m.71298 type:complete len:92 (+) Transcript_35576:1364-1639(+)